MNSCGGESADVVSSAKKIGLFILGVAFQRFLTELEHQQEVLGCIADVLMYAYAIESVHLRKPEVEMTTVFMDEAMTRIEEAARTVLAAMLRGRHFANESWQF